MLLTCALDQLLIENEVEPITAQQYFRAVRSFQAFMCKNCEEFDLTIENANAWICWLSNLGKSAKTVRNYRIGLCRVWNYLAQLGLSVGYNPKRIRQPRLDPKPPEAWSMSNVSALLKACDELVGRTRSDIAAKDLVRAWILLGYATGFRPSDLRRLRWDQIDFHNRTISIVQHKTGHAHVGRFDEATAIALEAIRLPKRARIFTSKSSMRKFEERLFKIAMKYGFKRRRGQSLGTLRKSHGTEVCRIHGLNAAAESLGHVSGSSIARLHYVQPDAMRPGTLPPALP